MNKAAVEADAVHFKLEVLWRGAMKRGEPVAVRIDFYSMRLLTASYTANHGGGLEITPNGRTWRGLPFVYEHARVPELVADISIETTTIDEGPRILTIECKDAASGRTVYFNDPDNPPDYR